MSTDDFDDIIADFAKERQATGATEQDELLGGPVQTTSLMVIPVREGQVLASVLKSGGLQGVVVGTEEGCVVQLDDAPARDAALELSHMISGADLLVFTKQGGADQEGQLTCERVRDGAVVDKPIAALVIDAMPSPVRRVLLMGEGLREQGGAIDIGSSPDPPAERPNLQAITPVAANPLVRGFDLILTLMVLLGATLLIMQGLLVDGTSWPRLIFGLLAAAWCIWRFTPSGRAHDRARRDGLRQR